MKELLLASLLLSLAAASPAATGPQLFEERCAPCHSIGGGDGAGPDLVNARRLGPAGLHAALKRMETNAGPLTAADVDSLVAFLDTAKAAAPPPKIELPRGIPANGRQLFFGEKTFANAGTPCFACHAAGGEGGSLGADLTNAKVDVAAVATKPAFPLMKAAYGAHPVTDAEALDLAAFVAETKQGRRERAVHGAAAGIALVAFAAVGLIVKRRRNEP